MAKSTALEPPSTGAAISRRGGELVVPDNPIIPFIEGDGTGADIWRASVRVLDAAVQKAYDGRKKIAWMEVFAENFLERQVT
jgi:isocitrate dehydrogenase